MATPHGPAVPEQGPSWTGIFGGILTIFVVLAIGVAFLADDQTLEGVVFVLLALLFIPALVASAVSTPRRSAILRASTVLAILIALLGGIVDFGIPLVMALPTVVLAQAAGLVFSNSRP